MSFYAFENTYGIIAYDSNNHRIGFVHTFFSKRSRDKFVAEHDNAEAITSKTARWYMLDYVAAREFCNPSDIHLNTFDLVCRYNNLLVS